MFYRNYIDSDFSDYLNRHIKGIILLKDMLQKIRVGYELSEAFSNRASRFWIDADFTDFNSLSEEDKQTAHQCLRNMWNNTGSKFVSFSYKPQRSHWVDFDEINSFIIHYSFAKELFEGVIRKILPPTCCIDIASLEDEPLFLYTDRFLSSMRYSREEKDMERKYRELTGRSFDFDCMYHNILKETAGKYPDFALKDTVSDEELKELNGGHVQDLRHFVLNANIPFNIDKYCNSIDLIRINMAELKIKLQSYDPNSYIRINPSAIIKYIDQKEKQDRHNQSLLENISNESNIEVGDYILIEQDRWGEKRNDLAVVKKISLNYNNQLEVCYALLKNDLRESKLPLKDTLVENISHSMHPLKVENAKQSLKNKIHLTSLLRREGDRNTFFKVKKNKKKNYG